jgi:hypothetical protein
MANEVHVERKIIWNVVLTSHWEGNDVTDDWQFDDEASAVKCADRLITKKLAAIRGEDKL